MREDHAMWRFDDQMEMGVLPGVVSGCWTNKAAKAKCRTS